MAKSMATRTLSDSDIRELGWLVKVLTACAARPSMYGNPEYVESGCKHLTHIGLSIIFQEWDFEASEKFWSDVAISFGRGEGFTPTIYEQMSYRREKWGDLEDEAKRLVLNTFKDIWQYVRKDCDTFPFTKGWVSFLFENPSFLGSPDNIDGLFHLLIVVSLVDDDCKGLFQKKYEEACIQLKGSSSRGLKDVGIRENWSDQVPQFSDQVPFYNALSEGINEVIKRLNVLRGS